MTKLGKEINVAPDFLMYSIMAGFRPHISNFVTQRQPSSLVEMTEAARLAEVTT